MSRAYKIWHEVELTGGKKSPAHFGANESTTQTIYVGTSAANSHEFAELTVERDHVGADAYRFRLYFGGRLLKSAIVDGKQYKPI